MVKFNLNSFIYFLLIDLVGNAADVVLAKLCQNAIMAICRQHSALVGPTCRQHVVCCDPFVRRHCRRLADMSPTYYVGVCPRSVHHKCVISMKMANSTSSSGQMQNEIQ